MRKHFVFYGEVQGVGFRWRARHLASHFGVTGFVRNLYDGSVEMEAEGTQADLDMLVQSLQNGHYISIDCMEVRNIPEQGSRSFEIL